MSDEKRNVEKERAAARARIKDIRESLIKELGEDSFNNSGHKEILEQEEGALIVEEENEKL